MALKDLRVGIVGLGDAGQLHFDNWSRTPGVRVLALCDVRSETAVQLTGSAAPFYYDAEDMFDSVELDAISLCTPTASHHPIGEMALARGISLLCEMPATPNSRLTEELIRTSHPTGARFQLASQFRNLGEVRLAKDLMEEGAIGEVMHFQIELSSPVDMAIVGMHSHRNPAAEYSSIAGRRRSTWCAFCSAGFARSSAAVCARYRSSRSKIR
jgi:predicted dehydrogenase